MSDREIVGWFTSEGQHIPIHKGESKQDAFNRAVGKREREIRANKEEADKRNVENSSAPSSLKQVDSKQFEKDLTKARDTRPDQDKWRVDEHTKEQLDERGCKCYTSQGGSTVAVDKNGDIISVCHPRRRPPAEPRLRYRSPELRDECLLHEPDHRADRPLAQCPG